MGENLIQPLRDQINAPESSSFVMELHSVRKRFSMDPGVQIISNAHDIALNYQPMKTKHPRGRPASEKRLYTLPQKELE